MKQVVNHGKLVGYELFSDINISIDSLSKKFSWKPIHSQDDLDEFKAVVISVLGESVILQEYLNAPEGMGVVVKINTNSNQKENILNEISNNININLDDFNWIHVGLDRDLLSYKEDFSIKKSLFRIGVRSIEEEDSIITGTNYRAKISVDLKNKVAQVKTEKEDIYEGEIPQTEAQLISIFKGLF